jgi:REP element-mobilizing transposase RayT
MPNHVHVLISFINAKQSINTIIGNGKRFMGYEMIERLKTSNEAALLKLLANHVEPGRKQNKKLHEVWELSFVPKAFGRKDCRSNAFIYQKLDYMHNNPFVKKWALCNNALEYLHSSAKFYLTGEQGFYPVTNFMEMEEVAFNETKQ